MRKLLLIFIGLMIFSLSGHGVYAGEVDLTKRPSHLQPGKIPEGIRYIYTDNKTFEEKAEWLKSILQKEFDTKKEIFILNIIIGPGLFKKIKNAGHPQFSMVYPVVVGLPMKGGVIQIPGGFLKSPEDKEILRKYLKETFNGDKGLKVRALTSNEMSIWWTVLATDIVEPVFVIESATEEFVVDIKGEQIMQIDDLNNLQELNDILYEEKSDK